MPENEKGIGKPPETGRNRGRGESFSGRKSRRAAGRDGIKSMPASPVPPAGSDSESKQHKPPPHRTAPRAQDQSQDTPTVRNTPRRRPVQALRQEPHDDSESKPINQGSDTSGKTGRPESPPPGAPAEHQQEHEGEQQELRQIHEREHPEHRPVQGSEKPGPVTGHTGDQGETQTGQKGVTGTSQTGKEDPETNTGNEGNDKNTKDVQRPNQNDKRAGRSKPPMRNRRDALAITLFANPGRAVDTTITAQSPLEGAAALYATHRFPQGASQLENLTHVNHDVWPLAATAFSAGVGLFGRPAAVSAYESAKKAKGDALDGAKKVKAAYLEDKANGFRKVKGFIREVFSKQSLPNRQQLRETITNMPKKIKEDFEEPVSNAPGRLRSLYESTIIPHAIRSWRTGIPQLPE